MRYRFYLAILVAVFGVVGCGTANNYLAKKSKTIEYYRIFDLQTTAPRAVIAKAAINGLGRNVNNAQEAMPIPTGELPEQPGRFKLVNPFEGSRLAALASASGGLGVRMVSCEGAVWTARAERRVSGSNRVEISMCLWQYKQGYRLDQYAQLITQEGGLYQVSRELANAMVGTPEQWTEKALLDVVRQIHVSSGAKVTLVEAQPEVGGTPWLDSLDSMPR